MGENLESSWAVGPGAGYLRVRKVTRHHFHRKLSLNTFHIIRVVFKFFPFFAVNCIAK